MSLFFNKLSRLVITFLPRGKPLNTAPPPGWNGFDQRVFNRGTGRYGIKGNVEWSVLHRTFFCRHTILAPFNGARVRETKWRGTEDNKSLNVVLVWDVALCGPCLPHPPPTAGRGAAATVPTPMPLAVPRFLSCSDSSMAPASGRAVSLNPSQATPPLETYTGARAFYVSQGKGSVVTPDFRPKRTLIG